MSYHVDYTLGTSIVIICKKFKGAMPSANGHAAGPSDEELAEDQNPRFRFLLLASTESTGLSGDRLWAARALCHLLGSFPECRCIRSTPEALDASSAAKAVLQGPQGQAIWSMCDVNRA